MQRPSSGPGSTTAGRAAPAPSWAGLRPRRRAAGPDPAALALFLLVGAGGCSHEQAPAADAAPEVRLPQQVIDGLLLRQTSLAGLEWELRAEQGTSYGPEEPTRLLRPVIRFYDGGSEVKSILTSKEGAIDERTRAFMAEDSVVVVTPRGERLETESLRWDPEAKRVTTEAPFRLTRRDAILTGVGIDADPDLTRYTVHGEVRAELRGEDDETILEALDGDSARGR